MILSPLIFLSQACVIQPQLVTSARQHWDPCSVPKQTQWITGRGFWISLQSDWQIDKAFFNRPIMASTQILVQRWGPRTRISALFHRQTYQSLVSSKQQVTCYLSKLFFFCLLFNLFVSPSTLNFQQEQARKPISTGSSLLQKNFRIYMLWFNFIHCLNIISLCFGYGNVW